MQVEVDIKMKEILSKQSLTIESLRNIILKGGSNKLKASMHNILDNKIYRKLLNIVISFFISFPLY